MPGMKVGYARVSTAKQDLSSQLDALTEAGCERIFSDVGSGKNPSRPGYKEMMSFVREGDQIVVFALDRLGRTATQLHSFLAELDERRIGFSCLTEGIDTTTPAGRLLYSVLAAVSEMEHALLQERVQSGLEAARKRGRIGGRPRVDQEAVRLAMHYYQHTDKSITEISSITGLKRSTIYAYKKAMEIPDRD